MEENWFPFKIIFRHIIIILYVILNSKFNEFGYIYVFVTEKVTTAWPKVK